MERGSGSDSGDPLPRISLECLELVREPLTIGHTLEALTINHAFMRFFNNAMGSFDPSRVFFDPGA